MSNVAEYLKQLAEFNSTSSIRLQALYSDISRQKYSNATGYQANISWWQNVLRNIVERGLQSAPDHFVLHVDASLLESFKWTKVGRPLALPSVVAESITSRIFIPVERFMESSLASTVMTSFPARAASLLIGKPLWWALEQLNLTSEGEHTSSYESRWSSSQGSFVILPSLEKAAAAVIAHHQSGKDTSLTGSLYDLDSFRAEFESVIIPSGSGSVTELDLRIILRYLERDTGAIIRRKDFIKFADSSDQLTSLSEMDIGIIQIKAARRHLHDQVEEIQRKIEDRFEEAKTQLRYNRTQIAKSYLRSKKQLEELLSNRLASLETVEKILFRLESAAGDIEIMSAYDVSVSTLKTLLAHPSLQREHVDEVMQNLSDVLADHAEIEQAIHLGGSDVRRVAGIEDVDEDEIMQELEALVKAERVSVGSPLSETTASSAQDRVLSSTQLSVEDTETELKNVSRLLSVGAPKSETKSLVATE